MKKKIILLFMVVLLPLLAAEAQNYTVAQARQRINAAARSMRSMTCSFTQTKSLKMLRSRVTSRGMMYYSRPNRLRWEYTSPYRYAFVMNGGQVMMRSQRGTNRVNVAQSKMFKEITRIMMSSVTGACVSGGRDFRVSLSGSGNSWHAVMIPRRNPLKQMFRSITVYFDMRRAVVTRVVMVERGGDTTDIQLTNIRKNTRINANIFSLR